MTEFIKKFNPGVVNYVGIENEPDMEKLFNRAKIILEKLQDQKTEINKYVDDLHKEYVDENYDEDNDGYNTDPDEEIKEIEFDEKTSTPISKKKPDPLSTIFSFSRTPQASQEKLVERTQSVKQKRIFSSPGTNKPIFSSPGTTKKQSITKPDLRKEFENFLRNDEGVGEGELLTEDEKTQFEANNQFIDIRKIDGSEKNISKMVNILSAFFDRNTDKKPPPLELGNKSMSGEMEDEANIDPEIIMKTDTTSGTAPASGPAVGPPSKKDETYYDGYGFKLKDKKTSQEGKVESYNIEYDDEDIFYYNNYNKNKNFEDAIKKHVNNSVVDVKSGMKAFESTMSWFEGIGAMTGFLQASMTSRMAAEVTNIIDSMELEIVKLKEGNVDYSDIEGRIEKIKEIEKQNEQNVGVMEVEGGGINMNNEITNDEDKDKVKKFLLLTGLIKQRAEIPHDFKHPEIKDIAIMTFEFIHKYLKTINIDEYKDDEIKTFIKDLIIKEVPIKKIFNNEWEYYKTILEYVTTIFSGKQQVNEKYRYVKSFTVNYETKTDPMMNIITKRINFFRESGYLKFFKKTRDHEDEKTIFYCDELCRPILGDKSEPIIDAKKLKFNFNDSSYGQMKYLAPLLEYTGRTLEEGGQKDNKLTNKKGYYTLPVFYQDYKTNKDKDMQYINRYGYNVANSLDPSVQPRFKSYPVSGSTNDDCFLKASYNSSGYKNPIELDGDDKEFINSFLLRKGKGLDLASDKSNIFDYVAKQAAIKTFQHSVDKFKIDSVKIDDVYFGKDKDVGDNEYSKVIFVTKGTPQENIELEFVNFEARKNPPNSIGEVTKALQSYLYENDKKTPKTIAKTSESCVFVNNYLKLNPPGKSKIGSYGIQRMLFFMISIKGDGDANQVEYMYNYRDIIDNDDKLGDEDKSKIQPYKDRMFIGTVDKNVFAHAVLQDVPCVMTDGGIQTTIKNAEKQRWFFDSLATEKILNTFSFGLGEDNDKRVEELMKVINGSGELDGPKRNYRTLQCISSYGVSTQVTYKEEDVQEIRDDILEYLKRCSKNNDTMKNYAIDESEVTGYIHGVFKIKNTNSQPTSVFTNISSSTQDGDNLKALYFAYKMLYEDMLEIVDFNKTLDNIIESRRKINEMTLNYLHDYVFGTNNVLMERYAIQVKDPDGINKSLEKLHEMYSTNMTEEKYNKQIGDTGKIILENKSLKNLRLICEALSGRRSISSNVLGDSVQQKLTAHVQTMRGRMKGKFEAREDVMSILATIHDMDDIIERKYKKTTVIREIPGFKKGRGDIYDDGEEDNDPPTSGDTPPPPGDSGRGGDTGDSDSDDNYSLDTLSPEQSRERLPSVFDILNKQSVDGIDNTNNNSKRSRNYSGSEENRSKIPRTIPYGSGGGLFSWLTGGSNNSSVVKRNRNGKTRHVRFKDSNNGGGKNKTRKVREWRW